MDGRPLTNVYAYGPDGKPLHGVQLFDQDGTPLTVSRDSVYSACPDASCDELHPEPVRLETGEQARNVYPLTLVPMVYDEFGELSPVRPTQAKAPEAPFVSCHPNGDALAEAGLSTTARPPSEGLSSGIGKTL